MTKGWYCSDCPAKGVGAASRTCPECASDSLKTVDGTWSEEDEIRGKYDD